MHKSDLAYVLGVTLIGSSIAYMSLILNKEVKPITTDEYESAVLACAFSEGLDDYYERDDGIDVFCYDGSHVWLQR